MRPNAAHKPHDANIHRIEPWPCPLVSFLTVGRPDSSTDLKAGGGDSLDFAERRWQDLPEKYPHPSTSWRRLGDWEEQGVWLKVWRVFLGELTGRQQLNWSESSWTGVLLPPKKGRWSRENQAG